jgi:squalene-hopene/tetraprenyl-beta-curcumene cyclase
MTFTGKGASFDARVDALVEEMSDALVGVQAEDGHWAFELEADATIPAEYILLNHFLDEVDDKTESKLANYLRSIQGGHGGWPLYHDGEFNISASVKAYYALKMCGDSPDTPHMKRAREAILANGGADELIRVALEAHAEKRKTTYNYKTGLIAHAAARGLKGIKK